MTFNYITITDEKHSKLSFHPANIENIKINIESVIIEYWEDSQSLKTSKTYILKKDNYLYTNWDSFINTLRIIFDV